MTKTVRSIIEIANKQFLMWAEPDEGSYNWKLFELSSRYDRNFKIPDDIPKNIMTYVKQNASKYYPIVVIDGFHLDSILDIRGDNSPHIKHLTIKEKSNA